MGGSGDTDGHPTLVGKNKASETPPRSLEVSEALWPGYARLTKLEDHETGGFASVEIAIDRVLQRRLAMKVMHRELQDDDLTLQLFAREVMITAQLDHPNIVPIHDVGVDDDGRLYFTMKLIEGRTLSKILEQRPGPTDWDTLRELVDVVVKLCDAVAFAHSRGVLHCDIKSDNVMVGDYGQVYLMDWGVAELLDGTAVRIEGPLRDAAGLQHLHLTHGDSAGVVLGTPAYMSPEQARGPRAELDVRADVYSLGAILYEVLTGAPPHAAERADVMMASARSGEIRRPSSRVREPIPPDLEHIVMKALARDRADRYPSVEALRAVLVAFVRGDGGFPRARYAAGATIIAEGDAGDAAYIIVSGRCEVFQTIGGERRVLRHMGPGEVFGEAAVLSPGPRTASVAACEPTSVLIIDRDALETEVGAIKPWLAQVMRTLAARFRDAENARVSAEIDRVLPLDSDE